MLKQKIDCDGCTKCCEWGGDHRLKVDRLAMNAEGNCIHLVEGGCGIKDKAYRPKECEEFTCTMFVKQLEQDCFMNVLIEGVNRNEMDKQLKLRTDYPMGHISDDVSDVAAGLSGEEATEEETEEAELLPSSDGPSDDGGESV